MSTADTNNPGIKLQAAGENLNTWGDPNLNNDFIVVSHLSSGWNPITINASYDMASNESNYSTTNPSEYAQIKLVAGTIAAAFNVTWAGRAKRCVVWNASGYAATHKLSATTGFSQPNNTIVIVGTDGSTDVYNLSPNYIGTGHTVTNAGDVANKTYVDTAIATASLPATSGTVLNSGSDTTAGYLGAKLVAVGSFFALTTGNAGANENSTFTFDEGGMTLYASIFGL